MFFSLIILFSNYSLAANAELNDISLSEGDGLDPDFSPTTTSYETTIETESESIELTIEPDDNTDTDGDPIADVTVNGNELTDEDFDNGEYTYPYPFGRLEDGNNQIVIEVTENGKTKEYTIVITKISFSGFKNNLVEGRPANKYYHMIEKVNNRNFEVRPKALKAGETEVSNDKMVFEFTSVNKAPRFATDISISRRNAETLNDIASRVNYTRGLSNKKKVTIEIPLQTTNINLGNKDYDNQTYTLEINSVPFLTFTIMPEYPPPELVGKLIENDNSEVNTLTNNEIYYLPKSTEGDYGSITLTSYPVADTTINYRNDRMEASSTYSRPIDLAFTEALTSANYNDNVDPDENDIWEIDLPNDVKSELQNITGDLRYRIVKAISWREGASESTTNTYYFVQDNTEPQVKARRVDGEGDSGEYDQNSFGTYESRRPQLKAKIIDDVSGIASSEDIKIKYRPLKDAETEEELFKDFKNANEMDVIDLEERYSEQQSNDGEQIVTFVPYNNLGEGEYAVKITAKDQADNSSDDYNEGDITGPFIFYLQIDQTGPRINNVSINTKTMDTQTLEPQAVSPENLEAYFEIYGAEDFIYGIRYLGEEEPTPEQPNPEADDGQWFVIKSEDISYVTKYIRTSFLNPDLDTSENYLKDNGAVENGIYEFFIIADEQDMSQDYSDLDDVSTSGYVEEDIADDNISTNDSLIGKLIAEADNASEDEPNTIRPERRTYVHIKFEVDGSPPEYKAGSLQYFENYPEGLSELSSEEVTEIQQGQPVFQATLKNASKINRSEIDVRFINEEDGRVLSGDVIIPPKVNGNEHTIQFQPVINLTTGPYSLEIRATDEFGNSTEEDQISFENIFKIDPKDSGNFEFSITDGERVNINQSSALEIELPEGLNPDESLRIAVNGSLIVADGSIVDEIARPEDENGELAEEKEILTRPDDYYKKEYSEDGELYYEREQDIKDRNQNDIKEGYQADEYDVFFFNNKRTIIIFSRLPFSTGRNEVTVEVVDENGMLISDSVEFMVDNYRAGLGFGRLLPDNGNE